MTSNVSILVLTFKRPRQLQQLLSHLERLELGTPVPDVEVIVVDNDPERSAEAACAQHAQHSRFALSYDCEPTRGIPAARNAALTAVDRSRDFVAFIDDDEYPDPDWLARLLEAQRRYGADVVAGPVLSVLPEGSPDWATRGKIFDHFRTRTGERIETCATNNVLLRRAVLDGISPWFDERFALTGGSDRHFFLRLHTAGYRLVWCDEAIVHEDVPQSRVNLRWTLTRMYRQGICNAVSEIDVGRQTLPRLRAGLLGAACIAGGLGLLPAASLGGSHRAVQFARYAAYGAGLLQACRGHLYEEYRTIHGD